MELLDMLLGAQSADVSDDIFVPDCPPPNEHLNKVAFQGLARIEQRLLGATRFSDDFAQNAEQYGLLTFWSITHQGFLPGMVTTPNFLERYFGADTRKYAAWWSNHKALDYLPEVQAALMCVHAMWWLPGDESEDHVEEVADYWPPLCALIREVSCE